MQTHACARGGGKAGSAVGVGGVGRVGGGSGWAAHAKQSSPTSQDAEWPCGARAGRRAPTALTLGRRIGTCQARPRRRRCLQAPRSRPLAGTLPPRCCQPQLLQAQPAAAHPACDKCPVTGAEREEGSELSELELSWMAAGRQRRRARRPTHLCVPVHPLVVATESQDFLLHDDNKGGGAAVRRHTAAGNVEGGGGEGGACRHSRLCHSCCALRGWGVGSSQEVCNCSAGLL